MTSPRYIRRLLVATACAWGLSASVVRAELGGEPLSALITDIQNLPAADRSEQMRELAEQILQGTDVEREQKRLWLKQQWAALSPEQREQLRDQIREHRERQREGRQSGNDDPRRGVAEWRNTAPSPPSPAQRLSPEDRQEFRQWMRERRGHGGREGN